jgi:atypical dual specificity phosphatase
VDFSSITPDLFIGTTPYPEDYDTLRALGVTLVINMRLERPPLRDPHNPAMATLWLPSFDSPLFPIPQGILKRGVQAALAETDKGGVVYVHCAAGVHRSVAMAACILIAQGAELEETLDLIKARREVADPDSGYIRRRIEHFARAWQRRSPDRGRTSP